MAGAPDSIIQTRRVLLLEDDQTLTTMIKEFLESHFYKVVAVSNGAEGVRSLLKDEFDIIICDIVMPKLPGDMFYFAVKKTKPHLCRRFVFITGYADNSKINDFITEVKGTMLAKPFEMDELLEAVASVQNPGDS